VGLTAPTRIDALASIEANPIGFAEPQLNLNKLAQDFPGLIFYSKCILFLIKLFLKFLIFLIKLFLKSFVSYIFSVT